MCFFDQLHWQCGHWSWVGRVEICTTAYVRPCELRLVYATAYQDHRCPTCDPTTDYVSGWMSVTYHTSPPRNALLHDTSPVFGQYRPSKLVFEPTVALGPVNPLRGYCRLPLPLKSPYRTSSGVKYMARATTLARRPKSRNPQHFRQAQWPRLSKGPKAPPKMQARNRGQGGRF